MNSSSYLKHSICYTSFKEIDHLAYQTIIRFFEENKPVITTLDFDEYFEILVSYSKSLFEIGAYQKLIPVADVVIEATIMNNLKVYKGEDIYEKTLFRKAACYYHLYQYAACNHILSELIKMNPQDFSYRDFLIKSKLHQKPHYIQITQGLAILGYFSSLALIAIKAFFIDSFKPDLSSTFTWLQNLCFISATALLFGVDFYFRASIFYKVNQAVREAKEKLKHKH